MYWYLHSSNCSSSICIVHMQPIFQRQLYGWVGASESDFSVQYPKSDTQKMVTSEVSRHARCFSRKYINSIMSASQEYLSYVDLVWAAKGGRWKLAICLWRCSRMVENATTSLKLILFLVTDLSWHIGGTLTWWCFNSNFPPLLIIVNKLNRNLVQLT